jgi:hypothetical protein
VTKRFYEITFTAAARAARAARAAAAARAHGTDLKLLRAIDRIGGSIKRRSLHQIQFNAASLSLFSVLPESGPTIRGGRAVSEEWSERH